MFPKIKKKITSFLLGEEGKISKHSLLTIGSFLSAGMFFMEEVTSLGCLACSGCGSGSGGSGSGAGCSSEGCSTPPPCTVYHTNDLGVSYSGDTATGSHYHHSSCY